MPVKIHATSLTQSRNTAKNHLSLERLIGRSSLHLDMERFIGISAYFILEGQISGFSSVKSLMKMDEI